MGKGGKKGKSAKKTEVKSNPLFERKARVFRVGKDIQPKRNLTRFVKWPKYIVLQRQRRILLSRLKVPPAIAQFGKALDKNQFNVLVRLLKKYVPEDSKAKHERLLKEAKLHAEKKPAGASSAPHLLKFGLNHVTRLIEEKKAKLVVIANNVDPIELVVWLPNLCRKMDVPYCFVKGKAALGKLVHQKNAAVVALTSVRPQDQSEFKHLAEAFRASFNNNVELQHAIGGGMRGSRSQNKFDRLKEELEKKDIRKIG